MVERLTPVRERTLELMDDPARLDRLLAVGASAKDRYGHRENDVTERLASCLPQQSSALFSQSG